MKYPALIKAELIRRLNRFAVLARIGKEKHQALLPNSGRLAELMVPGREILLAPQDKPHRKTKFDLALVRHEGRWVSVNSHLANSLFAEAILRKKLAEFSSAELIRREIPCGHSRLDFLLQKSGKQMFVEVKSVTLVVDGQARFPDAPTERGSRHLRLLADLVREGHKAAVVFVIQRNDAKSFAPNRATDPLFANTLSDVRKNGVEAFAYGCAVGPKIIRISDRVELISDLA